VFKVGTTFVVCIDFTVDEFELLELCEKRFIKEFDSLLCLTFGVTFSLLAEILSPEEIDVLLGVVALFLPVIVVVVVAVNAPYELNVAGFGLA